MGIVTLLVCHAPDVRALSFRSGLSVKPTRLASGWGILGQPTAITSHVPEKKAGFLASFRGVTFGVILADWPAMFARLLVLVLIGLTPTLAFTDLGRQMGVAIAGVNDAELANETARATATGAAVAVGSQQQAAGLASVVRRVRGFAKHVGLPGSEPASGWASPNALDEAASLGAPRELEVKWTPDAAQTERVLTTLRDSAAKGEVNELFGEPLIARQVDLPPALDIYFDVASNLGVRERRLASGRLRLRLRRATDDQHAFATLEYKRDDNMRGVLDREEFESDRIAFSDLSTKEFDAIVRELASGQSTKRLTQLVYYTLQKPAVEPVFERIRQVYGVQPDPRTMQVQFANLQTNEVFDLFRPSEAHLDRSHRIAEISADHVEMYGVKRPGTGTFDEFEFELAQHHPDGSARKRMDAMTAQIETNLGIADTRSTLSKYDRSRQFFGYGSSRWRPILNSIQAQIARLSH